MKVLYIVKHGLVVDGNTLTVGQIVPADKELYKKIKARVKCDLDLTDKTRILELDSADESYQEVLALLPKPKDKRKQDILQTGLQIKQVMGQKKKEVKLQNPPVIALNDGQPKLVAKTKLELDQEALSGEAEPQVVILPKVVEPEDIESPLSLEGEEKPKRGRKKSQ